MTKEELEKEAEKNAKSLFWYVVDMSRQPNKEELEALVNNYMEIAEPREKRIAELEKENAELKAKNKWYSEQVCNKECAEVWGQLTKVKDALRMIIDSYNHKERFSFEKDLMKAEQFISEVEK